MTMLSAMLFLTITVGGIRLANIDEGLLTKTQNSTSAHARLTQLMPILSQITESTEQSGVVLLSPTKITGSPLYLTEGRFPVSDALAAGDSCAWSSGSTRGVAILVSNKVKWVEIDLEKRYAINKVSGLDVSDLWHYPLYAGFKDGTAPIFVCNTPGNTETRGADCQLCSGGNAVAAGAPNYYDRTCGGLQGRYIRVEFPTSPFAGNIHFCRIRVYAESTDDTHTTINDMLVGIKDSITEERRKASETEEDMCISSVAAGVVSETNIDFTGSTTVADDATQYKDLNGCNANSECETETTAEAGLAIAAHNLIVSLEADLAVWLTENTTEHGNLKTNKDEKTLIEGKKATAQTAHTARLTKFTDAISILKRIDDALDNNGNIVAPAAALVTKEERHAIQQASPVGKAVLLMLNQALSGDVEKDLVITLKKLLQSCMAALERSKAREVTTHDEWIVLRDSEITTRTGEITRLTTLLEGLATKIADQKVLITTEVTKKSSAVSGLVTKSGACVTGHTNFIGAMSDFDTEISAIDEMVRILGEAGLNSETVAIRDEDDSSKHGVKEALSDRWELAMNINPSDGHNSGWAGQITPGGTSVFARGQLSYWDSDIDFGSVTNALTADFKDKIVFNSKTARWIAISRHQAGACDGYKVWKMASPESLLTVFRNSYRTQISTGGEVAAKTDVTNKSRDPIFEKDGAPLLANYYFANNGIRLTIVHDRMGLEDENWNNFWGLGIDSQTHMGRTQKSGSTGIHQCDVGDNGNSCFGSDHGNSIVATAEKLGDYAIYISETLGDAAPEFSCR